MKQISSKEIEKGLEILGKHEDSKLFTHINSCVRCGLCAKSCLYYLAGEDERFIPASKVNIVSSVYKRYFTFAGKMVPKLIGARNLDQATVNEMIDLLYGACTMCGRCVKNCSVGVDVEYVVRKGREMLAVMGYVPGSLQSTVKAALESGNNMAILYEDFTDTLDWMEEELRDELDDTGARIPLNEPGSKVLYTLNPREPKFFPLSISAMAKIFYMAKESWTLSTAMYDVTNYAYFSGHPGEAEVISKRMFDEMVKIKAERLVLAECGHGVRSNRWEAPNYIGKKLPFEVLSSVELIASYIENGVICPKKEKVAGKVTLHDPCNLVRGGGIVKEQRYIIKSCVQEFVEMTPSGIENFCCGGGGGQLAMSEYNERRIKIAEIKADQISKTGAAIVVAPCHNCIDQLLQINATYRLNVQIKTLAEIVADSL